MPGIISPTSRDRAPFVRNVPAPARVQTSPSAFRRSKTLTAVGRETAKRRLTPMMLGNGCADEYLPPRISARRTSIALMYFVSGFAIRPHSSKPKRNCGNRYITVSA